MLSFQRYFCLLLVILAQSFSFSQESAVLNLRQQREVISSMADTNLILAQNYGMDVLSDPPLIDDSLEYARYLNSMGNLFYLSSDFETAFRFYRQSYVIRENNGASNATLASSLMNLGNVMYSTRSIDQAIEYLRSSLRLIRKSEDYTPKNLAFRHNTIGLCYEEQGIFDSARYYFLLAINEIESDSTAEEWDVIDSYDNLANLLKQQGNIDSANIYLKKSLNVSIKNEFYYDIAWTADHLADSYISIGNRKEADKYLELAKDALAKVPNLGVQLDLAKTTLLYYLHFYNKDSVLYYLNMMNEVSEAYYDEATNKNIQEMETRYQVEKKEAALALSKAEAARLDAENSSQRIYLFASFCLLLVVVGGFLLAYQSYQRKKKITQMEMEIKDSKLDELMSEQESKAYAAMLKGQEREKDRVARELHDRLGGTLAALKMSLKRPENKVMSEDLEILDQALMEVRSISHNLSSGIIEKNGLNQALEQLFKTLERGSSTKFQLFLHPAIASLGQSVSLELYRIVQELATNTIKHAKATEVSLQTNFEDDTFNMIYEDNGLGFDLKKAKKGIGLDNVKARVKKINGILNIDTEIGRGTIIIVELNRKS